MLDDFREWLSDNLRYFELGGAILLLVLLLFFGIRACVGGKKEKNGGTSTVNVQQDTTDSTSDGSETGSSGDTDEVQNPLVPASKDIVTLIRNYYEAYSNKDIEKLRSLVDELSPTDEPQIVSSSFGNYVVGDIYTKNGLTDDSRVVFASYTYQVSGYDTIVPDASWLYVEKNSDGVWKVNGNAWEDSRINSYITKLSQDTDVVELLDQNRQAYNNALAGDAELSDYLNSLGQSVDSTAQTNENGTEASGSNILTVTTESRVRSSPTSESDDNIIGGLSEGDTVRKTGESGEWVQIDYDGRTAYVHSSLLREASSDGE